MNIFHKKINTKQGFSFIDVVVGSALMLIVFISIFSVFKMSVSVILNSKAKIGALALANERLELIRSMSFDDIGTVGGIPSGNIPQTELVTMNNIEYTRRVLAQYIDDPADGEGELDENGLITDYKKVKVEVTWSIKEKNKSISLSTNIVPKGIETIVGGGTLVVQVIDALGVPVIGANVHIENNSVNPAVSIDVFSNTLGRVVFPGSPSANDYEIVVSATDYSVAKTYSVTAENVTPLPGHLSVLEGETTFVSFQIDKLGYKTVVTFSPLGGENWQDEFNNSDKISDSDNVAVASGKVELAYSGGYLLSGYLYSEEITNSYLDSWQSFSWVDNVVASTSIIYRLFSNGGSGVEQVLELDLLGNTAGFTTSPIDISNLDTETYPNLLVGAFLNTENASSTPEILSWSFDLFAGPTPLPDIPFHMQGEKIIGRNTLDEPIYKYSEDFQTDAWGNAVIGSIEWDNYEITIDNDATGYDISEICGFQPLSLAPDIEVVTNIYLFSQTDNSLLVNITTSSGTPLENANVRLYRSGFESVQTTSSCGQSFFAGLSEGTVLVGNPYSIDISLAGYENTTIDDIDISGASKIQTSMD